MTVSGSISFYNKSIQIASPSVTAEATGSYSYPAPDVFGLDEVTDYNADEANRLASYISYTGRLVNGGSYWNLIVGSGVTTANATLYYQTQDMSGFKDGDMVVVTGYAMSVMSDPIRCAVIPTDIQLKVVPKITYDPVSDVAADGITNGTLPVTISNAEGWTSGITYDGEVVTAASLNSNEIAYTVSKNTGTTRRTGTIGVIFSKSGEENVVYSIKVGQLAPETEGTPDPETIVFANEGLENGVKYSEAFDLGHSTISFGGGGNDGKYYTTGTGIRTYGGGWVKVESANHTISKIEYTWSGNYKPTVASVATPATYDVATSTWTGSAKSITLTRPTGDGNWRLQAVKVTYSD